MDKQRVLQAVVAALVVLLARRPVLGVTIEVGSASLEPGSSVEIMVSMGLGAGEHVAGFQADIQFDPALVMVSGCRINPDIGPGSLADKTLSTSPARGQPFVRNIIFSANNVAAIPAGVLYACTFSISPDAAGSIVLQPTRIIASDPKGGRLPVSGTAGTIFVSGATGEAGGRGPRPLAPVQPRAVAPAPGAAPAPGLGAAPMPPAESAPPAAGRELAEPVEETTPEPEPTIAATALASKTGAKGSATPGTPTLKATAATTTTPMASGTPGTATAAPGTPAPTMATPKASPKAAKKTPAQR
ncbi:MAG: hypothetical protein HY699_17850 [Deltaproteobacteria bacterium]|nr:hypothetical protein [Deltaproteobacteria bacterium]